MKNYSLDTATCSYPFSGTTNSSIAVIGYVDNAMEGTTVIFECPPEYVLTGPKITTCVRNGKWEPCRSQRGGMQRYIGKSVTSSPGPWSFMNNIEKLGIGPGNEAKKQNDCVEREFFFYQYLKCIHFISASLEIIILLLHFMTGNSKMGEPMSLRVDVLVYILVVASSSAAVVFLVICIIVFIIGFACGHCRGQKFTKGTHHSKTNRPRQVPLYDEVLPHAETHQKQALKLKGNVAYLPSKSTVAENQ